MFKEKLSYAICAIYARAESIHDLNTFYLFPSQFCTLNGHRKLYAQAIVPLKRC